MFLLCLQIRMIHYNTISNRKGGLKEREKGVEGYCLLFAEEGGV